MFLYKSPSIHDSEQEEWFRKTVWSETVQMRTADREEERERRTEAGVCVQDLR